MWRREAPTQPTTPLRRRGRAGGAGRRRPAQLHPRPLPDQQRRLPLHARDVRRDARALDPRVGLAAADRGRGDGLDEPHARHGRSHAHHRHPGHLPAVQRPARRLRGRALRLRPGQRPRRGRHRRPVRLLVPAARSGRWCGGDCGRWSTSRWRAPSDWRRRRRRAADVVSAALRARARVLRHLPPRPDDRPFEFRARSYPDGYRVDRLGPPRLVRRESGRTAATPVGAPIASPARP